MESWRRLLQHSVNSPSETFSKIARILCERETDLDDDDLHALLLILKHVISNTEYDLQGFYTSNKQDIQSCVCICLTTFRKAPKNETKKLCAKVLLELSKVSKENAEASLNVAATSLESNGDGHNDSDGVPAEITVYLLTELVKQDLIESEWLSRVFDLIDKIILTCDELAAGLILGSLLSSLCRNSSERISVSFMDTLVRKTTTYVTRIKEDESEVIKRQLLVFCGVASELFACEKFQLCLKSLIQGQAFWKIVQSGFVHDDTLSRKRSLYIIQLFLENCRQGVLELPLPSLSSQPVFWWSAQHTEQLALAWDCFILLIETLEEKQIHVMRPVMSKMEILIRNSTRNENGVYFLHTSWVTTMFERFATHESNYMRKWGIGELFKLDLKAVPLLQQNGEQFLSKTLVEILNTSALYQKPTEVQLGECPPLVTSLMTFLQNACHVMSQEQLGSCLSGFVATVEGLKWSGVALVYLMKALASLQHPSVLDQQAVANLKSILVSCTHTMHAKFRGPISQFAVQFAANCLDHTKVEPWQFADLLAVISLSETLKRGTELWKSLCAWFATSVTATDSADWKLDNIMSKLHAFLAGYIKGVDNQREETDLQACFRLIVLLADSQLVPVRQRQAAEDQRSVESLLASPLEVAFSMGAQAYLSSEKALRVVRVLTVLAESVLTCQETIEDALFLTTKDYFNMELVDNVLQYCVRFIDENRGSFIVKVISRFADFLEALIPVNQISLCSAKELERLLQFAQNIMTSTKSSLLRRCCCLQLLASFSQCVAHDNSFPEVKSLEVRLARMVPDWSVISYLKKPADFEEYADIWGGIPNEYLRYQWQCVLVYLKCTEAHDNVDYTAYAERCLETIDVAGDTFDSLFRVLSVLIPKVTDAMRASMLRLGWAKLQEDTRRRNTYWQDYSWFVKAVAQDSVLKSEPSTATFQTTEQIFQDIFRIGEEKEILVSMLVESLCQWWMAKEENVSYTEHYMTLLVDALTFGPVHDKGKRFQIEVQVFLQSLGEQLALNQLLDVNRYIDPLARVHVLTLLASLQPSTPAHTQLGTHVTRALVARHLALVRQTSYKQFANSLTHRLKHRIFTGLLVLQPFANLLKEEMYAFLLEVLLIENQTSVRCQTELLLQRLVLDNTEYIPQLWQYIQQGSEKKPVYLCSLFSVMTQLAKLFTGQFQADFVYEAIPTLLPWVTSQQFSLRTFAQGALLSLWQLSQERGLERVLQEYKLLSTLKAFAATNPKCSKALETLWGKFAFHIDALRDCSMQTYLYTIPRLCEMTTEEWIPPHVISRYSAWEQRSASLPLYNSTRDLENCSPGSWKIKNMYRDDDSDEQELNGSSAVDGDVQKKVIPWQGVLPEMELDADLQPEYEAQRASSTPLVVVASLIDKVPNLGGLCRTCEIFGVHEYVLASTHYLEAPGFTGLSMTAHKWIPIREVKLAVLRQYLVEMKGEGYTLVGAEQTANSVCLTEYAFPEKTLLLLGNEKEGIPVDLIQLLDVCVEIPQQGLIRSLNVHVSGALLIWEYTRQQLLKAKPS